LLNWGNYLKISKPTPAMQHFKNITGSTKENDGGNTKGFARNHS